MPDLTCHPGETTEEFIARVVASAPPPTPDLIARLHALLPLPKDDEDGRPAA